MPNTRLGITFYEAGIGQLINHLKTENSQIIKLDLKN
jgi:hypothetical protein